MCYEISTVLYYIDNIYRIIQFISFYMIFMGCSIIFLGYSWNGWKFICMIHDIFYYFIVFWFMLKNVLHYSLKVFLTCPADYQCIQGSFQNVHLIFYSASQHPLDQWEEFLQSARRSITVSTLVSIGTADVDSLCLDRPGSTGSRSARWRWLEQHPEQNIFFLVWGWNPWSVSFVREFFRLANKDNRAHFLMCRF